MFDELQSLSDKSNVTMTIYVDDVVFSSEHKISSEFRQSVLSLIKNIITKYLEKGKRIFQNISKISNRGYNQ